MKKQITQVVLGVALGMLVGLAVYWFLEVPILRDGQRNATALTEAKAEHDQDRSEALLDTENKIAIAKLNLAYIESLPTKVDPAKLKLFEILGGQIDYEGAASRAVSDEARMIRDATWQPSGGDKEMPACPTGYTAMPEGATDYTCVPGGETAK